MVFALPFNSIFTTTAIFFILNLFFHSIQDLEATCTQVLQCKGATFCNNSAGNLLIPGNCKPLPTEVRIRRVTRSRCLFTVVYRDKTVQFHKYAAVRTTAMRVCISLLLFYLPPSNSYNTQLQKSVLPIFQFLLADNAILMKIVSLVLTYGSQLPLIEELSPYSPVLYSAPILVIRVIQFLRPPMSHVTIVINTHALTQMSMFYCIHTFERKIFDCSERAVAQLDRTTEVKQLAP